MLPLSFGKAHADSPVVTVQIDLSSPSVVSALNVGVTHVYNGIGISGLDPIAQASAESLLEQGVSYENRNIYGWGLGDPNPSPGVYNWSDLDAAVAELRKLGGTPVLTLCCSPGWMTSLGQSTGGEPDYKAAPTSDHYGDFAALAVAIAQRYPDITHFVIWNEVRGFNWDQVAFTTFYNTVYDALKAYNPALRIGGPYLAVMGGFASVSGTSSAPIPSWQVSFLDYFLANMHGADFLNLSYAIVDYNGTPPSLDQIMANTPYFETITRQVRARPGYNGQPIWWSEDYCDSNQSRLSYMSDAFQGACLASILYHELESGAVVSLRWSPAGDATEPDGQPDIESLFTDPTISGGGQPYPAYAAYQAFHDYFGPGVQTYTATSSSPMVEVLASASKTLLINKGASAVVVNSGSASYTLDPYQVLVVDTPVDSPTATSTAVPTETGTATPVDTASAYHPEKGGP